RRRDRRADRLRACRPAGHQARRRQSFLPRLFRLRSPAPSAIRGNFAQPQAGAHRSARFSVASVRPRTAVLRVLVRTGCRWEASACTACRGRVPGSESYDACYFELALRESATLATLDPTLRAASLRDNVEAIGT